jgi:hypothetical protein
MKSRSFEPFVALPALVPDERLVLAVGSPTAPRERLSSAGWDMADPLETTRDPWTYQAFVQRSKGEFGVAKHGYVVTHSGWFSERSANYLASGRPVLTQDTGFSALLPTGVGLLAYSDPESALAGFEAIRSNPATHATAASEIARAYFDSDTVMTSLLERVACAG